MEVILALDESRVRELVGRFKFGADRSVGSVDGIRSIDAVGDLWRVALALPVLDPDERATTAARCGEFLQSEGVNAEISVAFRTLRVPVADRTPVPGVGNLIAVASGKGGVGKSTVSANLAVVLAKLGARVGLLDADVYGPNVGVMFGIEGAPQVNAAQQMVPFEAYGVKLMTMGSLVQQGQPLVWRGPMTHKVLQQFLFQVDWGELDFLILDMPPGTGDIQLTITQQTPVSGALLVTTPQQVAVADARKGYEMFREVKVPILGLVENMSWYRCGKCDKRHAVFGTGGGESLSAELGVPLMAQVPLLPQIPSDLGDGIPFVSREPDSELARVLAQLALNMSTSLNQLSLDRGESGQFFPMEV